MDATYLLSCDGHTAVIEAAAASGLHLTPAVDHSACTATTAGTGQLICAAIDARARHVLLGVGGSATTDGGAGALAAIGAAGGLRGARITVQCDVETPFEQAAAVYSPQTGALPATVDRLAQRLDNQARILPHDPRGVPKAGAAGGLSGGLWAQYDADLVSGINYMLDEQDFDALLAGVAAVITGEGRLDPQTLQGKVIHGVCARRAHRYPRLGHRREIRPHPGPGTAPWPRRRHRSRRPISSARRRRPHHAGHPQPTPHRRTIIRDNPPS